MDSQALVQLALIQLACSQRELASRLQVSPAQVTKWKNGEHLSSNMEAKLRKLAGIGDRPAKFVAMAGSVEAADKWAALIDYLADEALDNSESGYETSPLEADESQRQLLCVLTFSALSSMGVRIPQTFPEELNVDMDPDLDQDILEFDSILEGDPYAATIRSMFRALTDVYGFFAAYLSELIYDSTTELFDAGENIEHSLLDLAACKIAVDASFAPKFEQFRRATLKDYSSWLQDVKESAFRAGIPLRAELLDLVHDSHDSLGHEAEAEALGFNASRIHPDIYMNELLVGVRLIHQVLPEIMKKLGIYEKFKVDHSKLTLGR